MNNYVLHRSVCAKHVREFHVTHNLRAYISLIISFIAGSCGPSELTAVTSCKSSNSKATNVFVIFCDFEPVYVPLDTRGE